MSSIDKYLKVKEENQEIINLANQMQRESERHFDIDKIYLNISINKFCTGLYGSSTVYAVSSNVKDAFCRAIMNHPREIMALAAKDAADEIMMARKEARSEAYEILGTLDDEGEENGEDE